jgi:hypothetical protein
VIRGRDQHHIVAEAEAQIVRNGGDRRRGILPTTETGDIRERKRLFAVVAGKDEPAVRQQDTAL